MTHILVVEDEPGIALALEDDMRSEGYEVEIAEDGETAIRLVREQHYELVLLDLMLPGKDGYEVCRELRRTGIRTPIIMLTAKTLEAEKVLGLELGADDYVTKPYSPRELRARVKAVLRRSADELPEIHRFADVEVDFARCEVRRGRQSIELTPLEFKLLTAFIHHRGHTLTRDQLLDQVWGDSVFVTPRVVDNQVNNLRRKIEPVPSEPRYVISVRGVGYRFDG
jgi:DNA-binding response OmpR family regulator